MWYLSPGDWRPRGCETLLLLTSGKGEFWPNPTVPALLTEVVRPHNPEGAVEGKFQCHVMVQLNTKPGQQTQVIKKEREKLKKKKKKASLTLA